MSAATRELMIFLGGLYTQGLHLFAFFLPAGTPLVIIPMLVLIETVSYLARALSLGVRL